MKNAKQTYSVQFNTDAETAGDEIEADTPEQALMAARQIAEGDTVTLWFERYSKLHPVNEIIVEDEDGTTLCAWQDEELRLRLAAPELLAAALEVIARWEKGDLAEAVRRLGDAVARAEGRTPPPVTA